MTDILFKYATKSRPELFKATLTRYRMMLSGWLNCRFVISCDEDDRTMNNDAVKAWIETMDDCEVHYNPPPQTKITAINANLEGQEFKLLVVIADDMAPVLEGYDARILGLFNTYFPQGDGVLHLDDGRTGRTLNTLPIMDRKYFGRFGWCYNPAYASLFADNELMEVSQQLGRAVYVDEVIIRHDWIGASAPDALHRHNEGFHEEDAAVYQARKAAGFPKQSLAFAETV